MRGINLKTYKKRIENFNLMYYNQSKCMNKRNPNINHYNNHKNILEEL